MVKLCRVLKVEVGGLGDFAKLGKQAILEKLQEKGGPELASYSRSSCARWKSCKRSENRRVVKRDDAAQLTAEDPKSLASPIGTAASSWLWVGQTLTLVCGWLQCSEQLIAAIRQRRTSALNSSGSSSARRAARNRLNSCTAR